MNEIVVSVFMLTYNHENYIAQAIEGILMQKTNFPIQLVIGEDFSTDKTREIVKGYAQEFPDKIKLLLNKTNLGVMANYVNTYSHCSGKYVAICDGDDFWIDPLKLQKQVDFLEDNTDYSIVYTNKKNLLPSGEVIFLNHNNLPTTCFNDLVFKNYIASVTVLFRNKSLPTGMAKWLLQSPVCDWPTYLWVTLEGGKIYYLDEITAIYRVNTGVSMVLRNNRSSTGEINLSILENILNDLDFKKRRKFTKKSILKQKLGLMASYNKEKRFFDSFLYCIKLIFQTNPIFVTNTYIYSLKRLINQ